MTIDFINPEREWPEIRQLAKSTSAAGFELKERLTVYPKYQKGQEKFLSKEVAPYVENLSRDDGLAQDQRTG